MHIINKLFNNETIRTVWDKEKEKYYVSIVDIVGVLAESKEPRKYWNWYKNKLKKDEDFEVSSITRQLKLIANDGKYRETDVADIEGMFRIIESIPSKNAEPVKRWLAKLGKERIDEILDPTTSIQRSIDLYRAKGYDEEWIARRIKALQERKKLTDVWKENGIESGTEYAMLTNEIYKEWSGMTAKEYKEYKGLRKENLRDNMTDIEVLLTDIGEVTTRELAKKHKPQGFNANKRVAKIGGEVAKNTRKDIEEKLGETVISKENSLNYKYIDDVKQLEENQKD
ncbi:MAG: phage antirepressor protein [Clostridia bacterium]|nr:phage antirepressor protein [Clostridia bacterium]